MFQKSFLLYIKKFYLYKILVTYVHKYQVSKNPLKEMERVYKKVFHKIPDIEHPRNLIEKIYWLQLHSDTSLWTKCADKYLVRDYVKECGLGEFLPRLYGKWDSANDIPFDEMPANYILKTNNGCGTCFIVRDGKVERDEVKKKLTRWLKVPYGFSGAQIHYTKIKPCIIAEELLESSEADKKISPHSVIDYKVWCFNGEPDCIWVAYDRTNSHANMALYDTMWQAHPEHLVNIKSKTYLPEVVIEKPKCLDEMLDIARKLSKPFKEVRVDFYVIKNKPVIGELTFTTGYGYLTEDYYRYMGSKFTVE